MQALPYSYLQEYAITQIRWTILCKSLLINNTLNFIFNSETLSIIVYRDCTYKNTFSPVIDIGLYFFKHYLIVYGHNRVGCFTSMEFQYTYFFIFTIFM